MKAFNIFLFSNGCELSALLNFEGAANSNILVSLNNYRTSMQSRGGKILFCYNRIPLNSIQLLLVGNAIMIREKHYSVQGILLCYFLMVYNFCLNLTVDL